MYYLHEIEAIEDMARAIQGEFARAPAKWLRSTKLAKATPEEFRGYVMMTVMAADEVSDGVLDAEAAEMYCFVTREIADSLECQGLLLVDGNTYTVLSHDGSDWSKWQVTAEERSSIVASRGGRPKKEASEPEVKPASIASAPKAPSPSFKGREKLASPPSPVSGEAPPANTFDYEGGLDELIKVYPPAFNRDNRSTKMEAYKKEVSSQEDHGRVLNGVNHYREYIAYRTSREGSEVVMKNTSVFSNFLKKGVYHEFQTSQIPDASSMVQPPEQETVGYTRPRPNNED